MAMPRSTGTMPVAKDGNRPARRSGDEVAADDDVLMEAATDVATGGAGSLTHIGPRNDGGRPECRRET
jgi:hypothetical protein